MSGTGTAKVRSPGIRDGIGESVDRPDGRLKVKGEFAYSSDLWADGMLWGTTVRSPHPHARIRSVDFAAALALPGVHAIQTHEDVPGRKTYGLELPDQPVLAIDLVRYQGEPVAIVAADHPETARRAAALIEVDYEVLEPLVDMDRAIETDEPRLHDGGNVLRRVHVRHGDLAAAEPRAELVVEGEYEIGMQDQAFLGPESGLALPSEDGGVDLYVATQWLHVDRHQVAASLDLEPERVRITNAGVGGAFGGREDLSMQIHACMLALHTGRPVKMVYSREESFFGHVHRHPARLRYEHGATLDGRLVYVKARIVLDGGAYASSSMAVCLNAASTGVGPYGCPNADIDSYVVYTNNPPCGAMRGFGAVQTCFAYEAQMDKLAVSAGIDPVELRRRNAMATGTSLPTGQAVDGPAPVDQLLEELASMPLPSPAGRRGARPSRAAGRRVEHHARRGHRARSRLRGRLQERRLLRRLRRSLDGARSAVARERRAPGRGPHGGVRGRAGLGDRPGADRPRRARSRARDRAPRRHRGRQRGVLVGVAPDLVHGRCGQRCMRGGPRVAARSRKGALRADGRSNLADSLVGADLATTRSRLRASTARARPSRSTRTARAMLTWPLRSRRTGPWSMSMSTSGWCAWSRSPPRRTSAGPSTRLR